MPHAPGESTPVWRAMSASPAESIPGSREPLERTQVCVIGGGIAGLTTAYLLRRAGHEVQLLEAADSVGSGETGRTTAHLSAVLDDGFHRLEHLFGTEGARLAFNSHAAAIDCIEAIVEVESLDCGFERLDGYLVQSDAAQQRAFETEAATLLRLGFPGMHRQQSLRTGPILIDGPALRFPRQAAFDIHRYMHGLARAYVGRGGHLAFGARAIGLKGGAEAYVQLDNGAIVHAQHLVVATNTPFNDRVALHTKQAAYRTYVVGFEIEKDTFPAMLLWDLAEPYHYVRRVRDTDCDVVLVGGEDHKTGQADDADLRYQRLEHWARVKFAALGAARYRWSGQLMQPVDALGFIGRNPLDSDNVYVITGDSGDGMTHGTLGGMVISDLIGGRISPWAKLYDPARKSLKAAGTYLGENANFVGHMVRDWVRGSEVRDREDIAPGEGAILREGLTTLAVYRDPEGEFHELSAVCTHLGCLVQWNGGEKSWDCPCHGSRFAVDGAVLHGPACAPLHPVAPGPRRPRTDARPRPRA